MGNPLSFSKMMCAFFALWGLINVEVFATSALAHRQPQREGTTTTAPRQCEHNPRDFNLMQRHLDTRGFIRKVHSDGKHRGKVRANSVNPGFSSSMAISLCSILPRHVCRHKTTEHMPEPTVPSNLGLIPVTPTSIHLTCLKHKCPQQEMSCPRGTRYFPIACWAQLPCLNEARTCEEYSLGSWGRLVMPLPEIFLD